MMLGSFNKKVIFMKFVLNGDFLGNQITGVQRYAFEITKALDEIAIDSDVEILVSNNITSVPSYKHIQVVKYGHGHGWLWNQLYFALYLMKTHSIGISLATAVPLLKPDIVCIHDISSKVNPQYYTFKSKIMLRLNDYTAAHRAKEIIAVSDFTKNEIVKYYKVPSTKIHVIYNAWQHCNNIKEDDTIFERYQKLNKGKYFFSLGSIALNKNYKWILNIAKRNPNYQFAVAGKSIVSYFGQTFDSEGLQNIIYLGYVSDSQVKSLMKHCKAFIFPSLYEGFGIPPLEALSAGAKIIVSNSACMPEIYGDSAYYINPNDYNIDLEKLLEGTVGDPSNTLRKYSWTKSAQELIALLEKYEEHKEIQDIEVRY